jgi:hypothetical protein
MYQLLQLQLTVTINVIEITGSRKSVAISTAKNLADNTVNNNLFLADFQVLSDLFTTNSTDSYTIPIQFSTDGGSNWNPGGQNMASINYNNGDINRHGCDMQKQHIYTASSFPITNPSCFAS